VPERFQIEEFVAQNAWGVVFQAVDKVSGDHVALRRFFPFGAGGGGLEKDEQEAYDVAIRRLSNLRHASLRGIIAGGCDPVDGMPFIVTEWVDGMPLSSALEHGPLRAGEAVMLVMQAMEVSLLFSEVLADEAIWVETDPASILIGDENSGRGFTFWISPMKWLGNPDESRGLDAIVTLAEQAMHWQGKVVAEHAGQGLGGWIQWLRETTPPPGLHEAMEKLAAASGREPPATAQMLVASATRPASQVRLKPSRTPIWAAALLALIVAGLLTWRLKYGAISITDAVAESQSADSPASADPPAAAAEQPEDKAAEASLLALRLSEENSARDKRREELAASDAIHLVTDREFLMENAGKQVVLEGVLENLRFSDDGKGPTFYLEFSNPAPHGEPRGYIMRKNMKNDVQPQALTPLLGKRVRMSGVVSVEKVNAGGESHTRPRVLLKGRESIKLAE
jgi:hypothetical protein